jgi:hypothetical protein
MLLAAMRRGGIVNILCAVVLVGVTLEGGLRLAGKIHILCAVGGQPNYAPSCRRWLRDGTGGEHDRNNRNEILHDLLPYNVAGRWIIADAASSIS